jgi:hypothetical protein
MRIFILIAVLGFSGAVFGDDLSFDRMMDSYTVAKADVGIYDFKDEELKRWPYTIQVAAYLSEKDAARHVQELKLQEDNAFYFPAFAKGQVWFKVCVGRFESVGRAEGYRKEFVKRMEEPFAAVIALGDTNRKPATADVALNLSKEASTIPVQGSSSSKAGASKLQVQLISKSSVKAKVASTETAVSADEPSTEAVTVKPAAKKTVGKVVTAAKGDHYTVQVASYPTKPEAEAKMAALSSYSSQGVAMQAAEVKGKIWYRVYVGLFTKKSDADAFRAVYAEETRDTGAFIKKLRSDSK